jgi:hypothetical protein
MKAKGSVTALVICLIVICVIKFADLQGKWTGIFMAGDNPIDLSYVFKVDNEKLTGSVASPQGDLAIYDGKTNGTDLSFIVDVNGAAVKSIGKFYAAGDSIVLNTDFNGVNVHSRLSRAK